VSLNNLGNGLSEVGQRKAALDVNREAVESYRALAAKNPDAFLPDLAMSLNNLGNRLSEVGQREVDPPWSCEQCASCVSASASAPCGQLLACRGPRPVRRRGREQAADDYGGLAAAVVSTFSD
jgi:hypothetical protein